MDKQTQKRLLIQAGLLLDNCQGCPKNNGNHRPPDSVCAGCGNYKKMREIGHLLEGEEPMLNMSVDEYKDYKAQGLTDKQIAEKHGAHLWDVQNWKKRNRVRASDLTSPDVQNKKPETIAYLLVDIIRRQIDNRMQAGIKTYGQTLDECPQDAYDWQQMQIEELLDGLQYALKENKRLRAQVEDLQKKNEKMVTAIKELIGRYS